MLSDGICGRRGPILEDFDASKIEYLYAREFHLDSAHSHGESFESAALDEDFS